MSEFIEWCKNERKMIQASLDSLKSGSWTMETQSGLGSPRVDAVPTLIEKYERTLAELEGIIARDTEAV